MGLEGVVVLMAGGVLVALGVLLGAHFTAKVAGQRGPLSSSQPYPCVVKTDAEEAAIERALAEQARKEYEAEVVHGSGLGQV